MDYNFLNCCLLPCGVLAGIVLFLILAYEAFKLILSILLLPITIPLSKLGIKMGNTINKELLKEIEKLKTERKNV
jgi:hypothetical protein